MGLARHMRAKPVCSQTTWEENWLAVRDNRVVGPVCSRGHRGCRSQRFRLQLAAFEENCTGAFHFIECASDVAGLKIDSTAAIDDDMCVQSELACIERAVFHAVDWVAHAPRPLASASSRSRAFLANSKHVQRPKIK